MLKRQSIAAVALSALAACAPKASVPAPASPANAAPAVTSSANAPPSEGAALPPCAQHFAEFDVDHDGRVTLDEFSAREHPHGDAQALFHARDSDADGALTPSELCAHAASQREAGACGGMAGGSPCASCAEGCQCNMAQGGRGSQLGMAPSASGAPGCGMGCSGGMPHGRRAGHEPGMAPGGGKGAAMAGDCPMAGAPGSPAGHGMGPGPRCAERFASLDANHDGTLTEQEFAAVPHPHGDAHAIFAARDQNHDGKLTQDEFCRAPNPPGKP